MASRRDYEIAIKIAGEIEKSLPKSSRLAKAELRSIANEAAKDTQKFNKSITRMSKISDKAFRAVGKAVKVAGVGVAAGLGASIKVGAEFEAKMSSVKAISGATADEMKRLEETALKYGSTTKFTAKEAGDALEYMALAGYDTDKSIEMLPNVLNLAAAGEMELGRASDQVTDAQSALNLSTKETTALIDQMARTSSETNTSVEQLGDGILKIGGTAKLLKGGTVELTETLGLLADNGIKGAEGGTHLRNILLALTAPTDKAAGAMEELGLSVTDKDGNFRSMASIIGDLKDELGDMTKAERTKKLRQIFNKTDIQSVNALLGTSKKRWKELSDEIENSQGAADQMAKTKLDNLEGDVTLFKSALEGAGVTIYKEIQEPLRELVQFGTKGVQDFSEWFVANFPAIKEGIVDIGSAIGALAKPFLDVARWLIEHPGVLAGTIGAIGAALITYKVVSGVQGLIEAISSAASLNPAVLIIGAAAAAIGGVAAAVWTMEKNAKKADLAKRFGEISLSMDDLKDAARQIVGAGDLQTIDELMSSISDSANISQALEDAQAQINKTKWKINAGLTISKDDVKSYVNECKSFAENAQKLIDQKGYEVNISTKLLFGDSDTGKDLTDQNNAFYTQIDKDMETLTDQLNKYLTKAMKKGLTPDVQAVIDSTLDAMSEITDVIAGAESKAKWSVLTNKWSGKDLTAENFEELQNQLQEFSEQENEGIDAATQTQIQNLYTQEDYLRQKGKLTKKDEKNFQKQRDAATAAGESKKQESANRTASFLYNTLQDTYGDALKSMSYLNDNTQRENINELVGEMLATQGVGSSSYGSQLRQIQRATSFTSNMQPGNAWSVLGDLFNSDSALYAGIGDVFGGGGYTQSYVDAMKGAAEQATKYSTDKMNKGFEDMWATVQEQSKDSLGAIPETAGKEGNEAADTFATQFGNSLTNRYVDVNNLILRGTYSFSPKGGSGSSRPPGMPSNVPVPHAKGGIFDRPHVGLVAEAGTESIIPIRRTKESMNLYRQTGDMLGVSGAMTFAPVVTINAPGGDKKAIEGAVQMSLKEFKRMYKQMQKDAARASL
ncbi:MAG: phage tail tape measure protein [Eubacterium sp.]|nr:phage tail tape measure protein [Eubacterium sp.]